MNTQTILENANQQNNRQIEASLLKSWTPEQFKTMQAAIVGHFRKQEIKTHHGNHPLKFRGFNALGEIMGFAYTSSGAWAGYFVCNTAVYSPKYDGYQYNGFAMSEDGKPFAWLTNDEENEIYLPL